MAPSAEASGSPGTPELGTAPPTQEFPTPSPAPGRRADADVESGESERRAPAQLAPPPIDQRHLAASLPQARNVNKDTAFLLFALGPSPRSQGGGARPPTTQELALDTTVFGSSLALRQHVDLPDPLRQMGPDSENFVKSELKYESRLSKHLLESGGKFAPYINHTNYCEALLGLDARDVDADGVLDQRVCSALPDSLFFAARSWETLQIKMEELIVPHAHAGRTITYARLGVGIEVPTSVGELFGAVVLCAFDGLMALGVDPTKLSLVKAAAEKLVSRDGIQLRDICAELAWAPGPLAWAAGAVSRVLWMMRHNPEARVLDGDDAGENANANAGARSGKKLVKLGHRTSKSNSANNVTFACAYYTHVSLLFTFVHAAANSAEPNASVAAMKVKCRPAARQDVQARTENRLSLPLGLTEALQHAETTSQEV